MDYQYESLGPALRMVVLAFLFVFALLALALIVVVAGLPGKIAKSRNHPQFPAINVCGWVGLPTGILWALALVWAFVKQQDRCLKNGIPGDSLKALCGQIDLLEQTIQMLESESGKAAG